MSNLPKISIITSVYNGEAHLERAIQSVLAQTYSNVEYVIVDGGSKDGTMGIIERYRGRIHKIVSERDKGIYDALNKGVGLATGDIIGFLHADDTLAHSKVLESIGQKFANENIHGLYSDLNYIRFLPDQTPQIIRYWKSCEYHPRLLAEGWMPPHPTLYLKKSVYDQVGGFDLNYPIAADYDFILRTFKTPGFQFAYLPEVTVRMLVGGVSNRNLKKIYEKSSQDYAILKKQGFSPLFTLLRKNLSKVKQFIERAHP